MLGQAMMLRGEDRRKAELPELFIIDALNEGSKGDVQLLCLRLMSGKVCYTFPPLCPCCLFGANLVQTNQEGKSQYGLAFRHKDVERCAVGALALYLFIRFHIQNEPWPPFHDREQWYKTKLLAKERSPYESLTYQAHNSVLNTAFTAAKCLYLKGTHVGRKEGCKLADMMDVPDAQMRRLGRWDHSRMIQHYSTDLLRQGARMLAGHGEKSGNIYPLYSFSTYNDLWSRKLLS
ncbi:MAG: hypothetical protein E6J34_19965 [Chloroflexi bacterium]|nr:MAG: hypothetical protein E6J34_19965 [Chloroflexota bacterium]